MMTWLQLVQCRMTCALSDGELLDFHYANSRSADATPCLGNTNKMKEVVINYYSYLYALRASYSHGIMLC